MLKEFYMFQVLCETKLSLSTFSQKDFLKSTDKLVDVEITIPAHTLIMVDGTMDGDYIVWHIVGNKTNDTRYICAWSELKPYTELKDTAK